MKHRKLDTAAKEVGGVGAGGGGASGGQHPLRTNLLMNGANGDDDIDHATSTTHFDVKIGDGMDIAIQGENGTTHS